MPRELECVEVNSQCANGCHPPMANGESQCSANILMMTNIVTGSMGYKPKCGRRHRQNSQVTVETSFL